MSGTSLFVGPRFMEGPLSEQPEVQFAGMVRYELGL